MDKKKPETAEFPADFFVPLHFSDDIEREAESLIRSIVINRDKINFSIQERGKITKSLPEEQLERLKKIDLDVLILTRTNQKIMRQIGTLFNILENIKDKEIIDFETKDYHKSLKEIEKYYEIQEFNHQFVLKTIRDLSKKIREEEKESAKNIITE